jgi:hypothetical protein
MPRLPFYPFPYTVTSIRMTSPGECHSDMLQIHCLLGSQTVSELQFLPYCQIIETATKIPK